MSIAWGSFPRDVIDNIDVIVDWLSTITPAQWCQAFYLGAAGCVLAIAMVPSREARKLLFDYGARKDNGSQGKENGTKDGKDRHHQEQQQQQRQNWLLSLMNVVVSWTQVPHSWFSAFYHISSVCSAFWMTQFLTGGSILRLIASSQGGASPASPGTTATQVAIAWTLMLLQATRRIYEHAAIIRESKSKMWVVHWVLGIGFYLATSVSVWVEGSSKSCSFSPTSCWLLGPPPPPLSSWIVNTHSLTLLGSILEQRAHLSSSGGMMKTPLDPETFVKIIVAVPAFFYAWVNQYRCHKHLAGLKKYSLPDQGMFHRLICPHYTCECLLYLSLAVVAAPQGELCNKTLLCALVFVVVNLGATAVGTRKWYAGKFGAGAVAYKWNMIPFIF